MRRREAEVGIGEGGVEAKRRQCGQRGGERGREEEEARSEQKALVATD